MDSTAREIEGLEDPENWDVDAIQIQPPVKHPGAVVSVEFNRSEFDQIAAAARQRGVSLTKFVRDAALQLGVWRD